jgi:hypothetical protein
MVNNDFLYIVGGYLVSALLAIAIIAWLQRGFLWPWLRVKGSRGAKVLVRVLTLNDDYFCVGRVDEGFLVFRDRLKETRRITVTDGGIYRSYGVANVDIDDARNTHFDRREWKQVNGFDAKKYDALYQRCLMRPGKNDLIIIVILIVVICVLFAVLYDTYAIYTLTKKVAVLGQIAPQTITPGVL